MREDTATCPIVHSFPYPRKCNIYLNAHFQQCYGRWYVNYYISPEQLLTLCYEVHRQENVQGLAGLAICLHLRWLTGASKQRLKIRRDPRDSL